MRTYQEKQTIFEAGKTYMTRDGREARIICADRIPSAEINDASTMVALVMEPGGFERVVLYRPDGTGHPYSSNAMDLMPLNWRIEAEEI